ncbi:MAG: protein kinase, partial [Myxococcota bacterium]
MEQLGKYTLLRRLGAGGMAEVYLARTAVAEGLTKELVIKKIRPAFARHRAFVSMFITEAKIALGLNHPNIVQVFDFGTAGDTFFLAMEFVDGVDLLTLLREATQRRQRIPLGLCAYICHEMAKGLDYAHRKVDERGQPLDIVHRDISPHNVLLSWDGTVKLVDFGIARVRGADEDSSGSGLKGKYSYMSPEQARGDAVDQRSDVYSLGVVLFELCCGRPLFPGRGTQVLDRVRAGTFPRPRDVDPDLPADLEQIVMGALRFHRDDRFASARDLQHALAQFLFEQAASASDISGSHTLTEFLAGLFPGGERPERSARSLADGTGGTHSLTTVIESAQGEDLLAAFSPEASAPGRAAPQRERKHVMVIEAQLRGRRELTDQHGNERAERAVAAFTGAARDIAFKHHGYVHRIDEDGATLLIGLPLASEDDASQAIRLGRALLDAVRGIASDLIAEFGLTVGVQRGIAVIARTSEGPAQATLGRGDRELAQALADKATPGTILVGSEVYRMARREWHLEEDDPILTATGDGSLYDSAATRRSRCYRLIALKARPDRLREEAAQATTLFGRDLELKALRDAYLDAVTTRTKRAITLVGEAGIGKRTLVNAFLSGIADNEARIIRATPQKSRALAPYAVIA